MTTKSVFFRYAGDDEYSRWVGVANSEDEAIEAVKYHIKGVDDDEHAFEVQRKISGFYVTLERVT